MGKTHTGKLGNGTKASAPLGYKTIIRPSKAATRRHLAEIGRVIASRKAAPQEGLIRDLNPMVRGWANYYSTVSSKETFSTLDHKVFVKLYRWAKGATRRRTLTGQPEDTGTKEASGGVSRRATG